MPEGHDPRDENGASNGLTADDSGDYPSPDDDLIDDDLDDRPPDGELGAGD
jgi:hypothetical protein